MRLPAAWRSRPFLVSSSSEELDFEDELDPGDELIQRLIEYRRFRGAADDLDDRRRQRALEHARGYRGEARDNSPERTLDLGDLSAWDLLATFSRLMRETLANRTHYVKGDPRPLRWFVHELGRVMSRRNRLMLAELIEEIEQAPTQEGVIGCFCALLELIRLGVVTAEQARQHDGIRIALQEGIEGDFEDLIGASSFMDEIPPPA